MTKRDRASWLVALAVFLATFGAYSYRLGIEPVFWHDDYEYTYPSFSLAERGSLGSPVLGSALNLANRTYHFTSFYYYLLHAGLIRLFGTGPESIPLANTFSFGVVAAAGAAFLARRGAFLGLFAFLYALVSDDRMLTAARHGRPEMTAASCLFIALLALWTRVGERDGRAVVLLRMSAALTAAILSHGAALFFAAALFAAFAVPVAREARRPALLAGVAPYLAIPLLYGYFVLTDSFSNVWGQMSLQQGNVVVGQLIALLRQGHVRGVVVLVVEFLRVHAWHVGVWLALGACLAAPAIERSPGARAARFFAGTYCLLLVTHFLFLKHFVSSYRVVYQATLYLALALLADSTAAWLVERRKGSKALIGLRLAAIAVLACVTAATMVRFRERLHGQHPPYARLQGALGYALASAGARPGDRVFVPTPFAFHLRYGFDVLSYPPNWRYFTGQWAPPFGESLRELWGREAFARLDPMSLCWAMGLAFARPAWVVSWNADYGVMEPFRNFLRRFPELPGIELREAFRSPVPPPYGGVVRVYRLDLSETLVSLERKPASPLSPCP
jgi:hypothetical protein